VAVPSTCIVTPTRGSPVALSDTVPRNTPVWANLAYGEISTKSMASNGFIGIRLFRLQLTKYRCERPCQRRLVGAYGILSSCFHRRMSICSVLENFIQDSAFRHGYFQGLKSEVAICVIVGCLFPTQREVAKSPGCRGIVESIEIYVAHSSACPVAEVSDLCVRAAPYCSVDDSVAFGRTFPV